MPMKECLKARDCWQEKKKSCLVVNNGKPVIAWYVMQVKHILNLSWRTSAAEHILILPL